MAKTMKPTDVRLKTADELGALLLDLRKEQFNLRFQRATGQNEGVSRVRVVRRDIARVKTILAEKQRASVTTPAVPAGAAGQS
jgi:large subunit ribosomal protein L29